MTTKSYRFRQFRDSLKEPGYLSQFDVARIRKIAREATDHEFQEYLSCDKHDALRIIGFWEIAQVELWDAEILKRFFHVWIYEDRDMVAARIHAAQRACRLPEHFTPEVGLQWLESENVLTGRIPEWIRANARPRAPVVAVGASDGVELAKAAPLPLTTGDIAFCFAGLRWKTETEWKKPLGDKPKWLEACIVIPGERGVSETRWSPVCIGAALVRAGHGKPNSVRAKFQTEPLLKPWLDEWKTYEADNFDSN